MKTIYSIGVMTGTSCDGADLALLSFKTNKKIWNEAFVNSSSIPFPTSLRSSLRLAQKGKLSIPQTAQLTQTYSLWLAKVICSQIKKWKLAPKKTLLSIHGQTVWHEPPNRSNKHSLGFSVQILDPALISYLTKCTVVSSFRQPDLARQGQGAPLVPYYHWLRAVSLRKYRSLLPFAIHNIGGIANLTYLSKNLDEVFAFDTGPGNCLIDLAVEKLSKNTIHFDNQGAIANRHLDDINWKQIEKISRASYFKMKPPKSTGREQFNENFLKIIPGKHASLISNATALTAHTMAQAYANFVKSKKVNYIFLAGGGALNKTLNSLFQSELQRLAPRIYAQSKITLLPVSFAPIQALEAMAFARLGFEGFQGNIISLSKVTGAQENASGAAITPGDNFKSLLEDFYK